MFVGTVSDDVDKTDSTDINAIVKDFTPQMTQLPTPVRMYYSSL